MMNPVFDKSSFTKIRAKMPIELIGRAKGLPSGQVHDLVEDKGGIFWLVGPNGLSKFDGSRVRTLTKKDGLSTHGTRSVAVAADGRIWVGSDSGLDIVEADGKINRLGGNDGWEYGFVECIEPAPDGTMWIGTADGLLHWSPEEGLKPVWDSGLQSGMIYSLLLDSEGVLWVAGGNSGLLCYAGGVWCRPKNDAWESIGNIRTLALGKDAIYAGGDNGMIKLPQSITDHEIAPIDLDPVTSMLEVDEELWVGVSGELRVYKDKDGTWFLDQVVVKSTLVNSLRKDSTGNIWCATDTAGLIKISALRKAIIQPEFSQQSGVFSIRKASDDSFLIGGEQISYRVSFKDGVAAQSLPMLSGSKVWDLIEDKNGALWVATQKGLLKKSKDGSFERVSGNIPALLSPGRALHERKDEVWYGTLNGLLRFENDQPRLIKGDNGKSLGYVYTITEDRHGKLWIGTLGNGLWMESGGSFTQVSSGELLTKSNVYAISADNEGRLAIAQDNKIFLLSEDGQASLLVETEQPVSAWSLKWFGDDRLLAGSSGGLTEYDASSGQVVSHIDTLIEPENWEFTTSRSLFVDGDKLICGLNGGLAIVDKTKVREFQSLPKVRLESISWSNAETKQYDNCFTVNTGKWTMEANVYSAWFLDESNLKYRFRLVGFDNLWTPLSDNPGIHFNSLPAGKYTLEAQAFTPLFGWGPVETVMEMRVKSPWWARGIFSLPYMAVDAVLGLIESRRRNTELLERNMELEFHVKERTQEIQDANRTLKELNEKLQQLSSTDALLGIANRRLFDEVFDRELERARRSESPISLILCDVDHFKAYNDRYGHQQGDKCLKAVALALSMTLRESGDLVARYGGEEFAVILPYTTTEEALVTAERLRATVENLRIPHADSPSGDFVTVSLGVASGNFSRKNSSSDIKRAQDDLIALADVYLYSAKARGRNRAESGDEVLGIGKEWTKYAPVSQGLLNDTSESGDAVS